MNKKTNASDKKEVASYYDYFDDFSEEEDEDVDEYRFSKSNRRQSSDKARAKLTKKWSRDAE